MLPAMAAFFVDNDGKMTAPRGTRIPNTLVIIRTETKIEFFEVPIFFGLSPIVYRLLLRCTMNGFVLIAYLGILTALAPLSTDMYLPALPEMSAEFGISASLAQATLTMTMVGMALGQVVGGPVSDKMGRKLPLFGGLLVFTAASLACVFVDHVYYFLGFRFLQGFSGAFGIVIARAVARDVKEGPELMKYFAILMMVNGLAPILAPVVGGQILLFTTWRGVFAVLVAIGGVMLFLTAGFKESLPAKRRSDSFLASFRNFPILLRDPYFRGHCLAQCFVFGAFFAYLAGSSFLFQNVYGISAQGYSLIFGGIGAGGLLAGMIPAKLAGAVREVTMMKWSILVPAVGSVFLLVGFLMDAPIWYTLPILFVTVTPISVLGASSVALALAKEREMSGSASALLGFFSMILGGRVHAACGNRRRPHRSPHGHPHGGGV